MLSLFLFFLNTLLEIRILAREVAFTHYASHYAARRTC
jgi:hypothetical protein